MTTTSVLDLLVEERNSETISLLFNKRWVPHILAILSLGPRRFTELRSIYGITDRILADRLRELQGLGLVVRDTDPGPPLTSSYRLSDDGERTQPIVAAIVKVLSDPVLTSLRAS